MRALVFHGPWQIGVEQRPDPVPGPDDALLRIIATGICGSDLHGFTGENGRRSPGQVMGHETVARVVKIGPGVDSASDFAPGALVTFNPVIGCGSCEACREGRTQQCVARQVIGVTPEIVAGMAEYATVPAANLVALPDTMAPELGALVEPLAVGYHAARRGHVSEKDTVLVVGGGPIGQASALAARRLGASRILVSEPDAGRRRLVEDLDFTSVDPGAGDIAELTAEHLGGPASIVFDAVGTSATLADALECSRLGARIVLVGMNEPSLSLQSYALSTKERTLVGSFCYTADEFASTATWVAGEGLRLASLIDGSVDLDGAQDAFHRLADGSLQASKILIFPHGTDTKERAR